MQYPARIFGNEKRFRFLTKLVEMEPCSGNALAHALGLEHKEEIRITQLFLRLGIITRADRYPRLLSMSRHFFAAGALRRFLHTYAANVPSFAPHTHVITQTPPGIESLFGGKHRSRVLFELAESQSGLTMQQLSKRLSIARRIRLDNVSALIRDGLIVQESGEERRLKINGNLIGYEVLICLIRHVGRSVWES